MQINPYKKTDWLDHIKDVTTGQIIQEGTRFNASRANNLEEGIYNAYEWLIEQEGKLLRMQVLLELDGRAPGNSGAFADTMDGETNKLIKQVAKADVLQALDVGATSLTVDSVADFAKFERVTIYDGTKREDVLVTAVDAAAKKLTVQALKNAYVKGAKVARSDARLDTANKKLSIGAFETYTVAAGGVL